MDELIDILDSKGNFTGKTALKSEAHKKGLYHPTIHVWFYTSDGKILLQQRSRDKDTHPLLWDVSVAGHIGAGESIEIAALREVEEEIGLTISQENLQKIGVFKSFFKHNEHLIDNEFHHTFLCELKTPIENLKKQESEVEALDLVPISTFEKELNTSTTKGKYVPNDTDYYPTIIKAIKERL